MESLYDYVKIEWITSRKKLTCAPKKKLFIREGKCLEVKTLSAIPENVQWFPDIFPGHLS